ncbi:stage II sporulation protein M [Arsenicicoccus bolidensis]|uniref:Stage II sporulation protein M n=1 Tax=Arsenicicoccus bolidensis TaxID=229480 RepID=A0ABS9Q5M7_9MICO|nr:stage II sporulation protein M [Arsenicicoccus bolidensis]MCG7323140.1 stage II sporulation protein M [Arsenicicoccus bolidensis]
MDLDAYVAAHRGEWDELDALTRRSRLSAEEADRLLDLYQRVGTHLAVVRTSAPDPAAVQWLSGVMARARRRASGTRTGSVRDIARFFTETFPATLYHLRWWWLTTTVLSLVVAFAAGWWFYHNPTVENSLMSPSEVAQYVNTDFESYYSEHAATSFAARVWTNNAWVAAQCIAMGVLGAPVVYVLLQNVISVGVIGALMVRHGRGALFFGLILPHGLLELAAVFVAAGVGLRLFWSWVEPGPRTRMASLAAAGRTTVGVAMGLVVVLLVSGVLEAFVTPSGLPTWARITIGVLAEVAFFAYVFVVGRRAAARGVTGDVDDADREDEAVASL